MVREPLTPADRARGERLGRLLRQARAGRSLLDVAGAAGISAETLRKIETGRIPTPAFFTVSSLADVLGLSLDVLVTATEQASNSHRLDSPERTPATLRKLSHLPRREDP
ncbi:helix-turn-helix domain-containing protein [Pseudonocardia asaccharolytica]|uniref:Transcriptional regulator n=1 Tax=Pseudonocardia asaccharolytica DSM 44247 = NBRC 16224 TaxID=1123024 RepID=A0A511CY73_9PSEU|nr:helix-turn-helix transcriptional regulator [Pseudonocardia asaccharolytica]GEL17502.1 transcriptional regulator [Pseudonocardia asaccharolytica DSM 44247 = NBRC 16224]